VYSRRKFVCNFKVSFPFELHYADTVKSENDTVFSLIQQNKNITAIEVSERLDLSLNTVKQKI